MIDQDDISESAFIPRDSDFPPEYVMMKHPEDLIRHKVPLVPANGRLRQWRYLSYSTKDREWLIARIPVAVSDKEYVMASFVIDTKCRKGFMLGEPLLRILDLAGRTNRCEMGNIYLETNGSSNSVEPTPSSFKNVNIIGLQTIKKWGLQIDGSTFRFVANIQEI